MEAGMCIVRFRRHVLVPIPLCRSKLHYSTEFEIKFPLTRYDTYPWILSIITYTVIQTRCRNLLSKEPMCRHLHLAGSQEMRSRPLTQFEALLIARPIHAIISALKEHVQRGLLKHSFAQAKASRVPAHGHACPKEYFHSPPRFSTPSRNIELLRPVAKRCGFIGHIHA
jgi:hypothetical protein